MTSEGLSYVGYQQHRGDHDDGDDDDGNAERASNQRHLLLQRCRLLHRGVEHGGDSAHLGLHAGSGDDGATSPLNDRSALENHTGTLGERRRAIQGGGIFQNGLAFPGERCFLHTKARREQKPTIGAYGVAFLKQQDVARDQLGARDAHSLPVAQH